MTDLGGFPSGTTNQPAPWVYDVLLGIAVTLVVCLVIASDVGQTDAGGWPYLWAVGLGGLMLVRRQYPALVAFLSVAVVLAYHAAGYSPIGVAVPVAAAVFSAAEQGRVAAAVAASATIVAVSVTYRLAVGQDPALVVGFELPGHVLLLAGAIALGDSVRARRQLRRQADEISRLVTERTAKDAEQRVIKERLAIARELHDSVGHALTVISLHAQVAEDAADADPAAVQRALQIIQDTTSATVADLRRAVAGLRDQGEIGRSPLKLTDLDAAVAPARQAGLEVDTDVVVQAELSPSVEAAIYRIVQESITNVVRHAHATHVDVRVHEDDGLVRVEVINDESHAMGASPLRGGNGLIGMRERAHLLGGTFDAGVRGAGFAVSASIPVGAK